MQPPPVDVGVGHVNVVTTNGAPHPPEYYAGRAIDRIMSVAASAPEPIRLQAEAFREQMRAVIYQAIVRAIADDRNYRKPT